MRPSTLDLTSSAFLLVCLVATSACKHDPRAAAHPPTSTTAVSTRQSDVPPRREARAPQPQEVIRLLRDGDDLFAITSAPIAAALGASSLAVYSFTESSTTAHRMTLAGCNPLRGFAARAGKRFAVCGGGESLTTRIYERHEWTSSSPLVGCRSESPIPTFLDASTTAVACDRVVYLAERDRRWRTLPFEPAPKGAHPVGVVAMRESLLVGLSAGEWGGGMVRIERASGRTMNVDLGNGVPAILDVKLRSQVKATVVAGTSVTTIFEVGDDGTAKTIATNLDPIKYKALAEEAGFGSWRQPPFVEGHVRLPKTDFGVISDDGLTLYNSYYGIFDVDNPVGAPSPWSLPSGYPGGVRVLDVTGVERIKRSRIVVASRNQGVLVIDGEAGTLTPVELEE
jgi:hypothetical protein